MNEEATLIQSHPWDAFIDMLRNTAVTAWAELFEVGLKNTSPMCSSCGASFPGR